MNIYKRIAGLVLAATVLFSAFPTCTMANDTEKTVNYALDCEVRTCVSGEKTPVSNVIDGDIATDWSTWSTAQRGCVELSLPQATMLNKVTVVNGTSVGRNLKISVETSADGYDWYVRRKNISLDKGTAVDVYFENTLCEYVRVNVTEVEPAGKYYGFSIAEVELYYDTNTDKEKLAINVQSAENTLAKFSAMSEQGVIVPQEASDLLLNAIQEGKAVLADNEASQYSVDIENEKLLSAIEGFNGMVMYSDSVFENILERQKQRQIAAYPTYSDSNDIWQSMDTSENAEWLWEFDSENAITPAGFLKTWGDNFYKMARSYLCVSANQGNKELLADIEYGLEWLYKHKYNEDTEQYGNWWTWCIGGPKRFILTLMALKDDINPQLIENLCNAMLVHMGDFWNMTGANRTDAASVAIPVAAFLKDGQLLYKSQQCILEDLVYKEDGGTGHYKDGSYLYHQGLSYNGGYGKEQLKSVASILTMTAQTPFQVDDYYIDALKDNVENGYDPLSYKGHFTYAAAGRQIYQETLANNVGTIIGSVADCLTTPDDVLVKSLSLKMMQQPSTDDVIADDNYLMHKRYAAMDRTAHLNNDFGFYLSTFSPRSILFEAVNGQNMLGWYNSAGRFYLETGKKDYYGDGYMETIDWYRLPGTTVDTVAKTNRRWDGEDKNPYEFVGGAKIDNFGIEAMEFGLPDSDLGEVDLHGKKSWFMFDDEIVFLGSDITETTGNTVETIVDNVKIDTSNLNRLIIDGQEKSSELGKTSQFVPTADPTEGGAAVPRGEELEKGYNETLGSVGYVFLETDLQNGIGNGYVFPEKSKLKVKREERTGSKAVTDYGRDTAEITRNWVTMWIDHGVNPTKASYEWVLLPQKSAQEIEKYVASPDITVIENSANVQAVKETKLNILGVHSYRESGSTVEGITVDKPASYMLRETESYYEFSLSEPMRSISGKVHVEAALDADKILLRDEQIENVSFTDGMVSFDVNITEANGNDFRIVLGKTGIFTDISDKAFSNAYMKIGNDYSFVGGRVYDIVSPVIQNGTVYVPLRFVAEALGGRVAWDASTSRIQIVTDKNAVIMTVGSSEARLNGSITELETAPIISGGTTMVSLETLSLVLGVEIKWYEENQLIEIVPEGATSQIQGINTMLDKLN